MFKFNNEYNFSRQIIKFDGTILNNYHQSLQKAREAREAREAMKNGNIKEANKIGDRNSNERKKIY